MPSRLMIDPRAYYLFAAVAEELSFTRAARRLGMAQPNLSTRIRLLEKRIGRPLFVREGQRIALTPLGERLHAEACGLVREIDRLDLLARSLRVDAGSQVRIGGVSATIDVLPRQMLVDRFMTRFPAISLSAVELPFAGELEALAGDVDFLFTFRHRPPGLRAIELAWRPLLLLVPRELPVAALDDIPLDALRGIEVIDWHIADAAIYEEVFGPVARSGARLVRTPDPSIRPNIHYAARRRAIFPLLGFFAHLYDMPPDMVLRPIRGPRIGCGFRLLARDEEPEGPARSFWALAAQLAEPLGTADRPDH